jgi:hypothetical protein
LQQVETNREKLRQSRIDEMIQYAEKLLATKPRPSTHKSMWSFVGWVEDEASRRYLTTTQTCNDYAITACRIVFAKRGWKL